MNQCLQWTPVWSKIVKRTNFRESTKFREIGKNRPTSDDDCRKIISLIP